MTSLNNTTDFMNLSKEGPLFPVNIPYVISEIIVGLLAGLGNALTLYVFAMDNKLRRLTNYYIASLALADFLLGVLGIPFAILTSLGLPRDLPSCLIMISSLLVLCAVSILSLVAVSIDRYWAIIHPIAYSRIMTGKIARINIFVCWILGTVVGLLPVFGWHEKPEKTENICRFTEVINYDFLVFFYFAMIITPGLLMIFFYIRIYLVVARQEKRYIRSKHGILHHLASLPIQTSKEENRAVSNSNSYLLSPISSSSTKPAIDGGSSFIENKINHSDPKMSENVQTSFNAIELKENCQRLTPSIDRNVEYPVLNSQLTKARGKEIKAAKNLSIIVGFFFICWFPINTINCIHAFHRDLYIPFELIFITIILSHVNSAVNPILYAYNMKDFRRSFENFFYNKLKLQRFKRGRSPISIPSSTDIVRNLNQSTGSPVNISQPSSPSKSVFSFSPQE